MLIKEGLLSQVELIINNYKNLLGVSLIEDIRGGEEDIVGKLYNAPFVVLSHNTDDDPIFNYANKKAQELFEMPWDEITSIPSRLSAEPVEREERVRLLNEVSTNGYIKHYSGIRVSKSKKRFMIKNAVVWNLFGNKGEYRGQAATFSSWQYL